MTIASLGYVYLIESHGQNAGKVGYGADPHRRVIQMQTGNPQPLVLASALPATYPVERALHRLLAPYRLTLEWFSDLHILREVFCELEQEVAELEFDDADYTVTPEMVERMAPIAIGTITRMREAGELDDLDSMEPLALQGGEFYPLPVRGKRLAA